MPQLGNFPLAGSTDLQGLGLPINNTTTPTPPSTGNDPGLAHYPGRNTSPLWGPPLP